MIYAIRQTTDYAYGELVPASRHIIRMWPLDDDSQTIVSASLSIWPQPAERHDTQDFFGNRITHIAIDTPHDALRVTLDARVEVKPCAIPPQGMAIAWEEIAAQAMVMRDAGARAPVHCLFPSRLIALDPAMTAYAAESFQPGRSVLDAVSELNRRIRDDFAYDTDATEVDTDPAHAFALRRGVCQDFAHIMIAALRGLGLPAAYVSGFLRTEPPPGQERLEGADATHAWVSVWCGAAGWVGFDPTNGIRAGSDHVRMAEGRDYADVAPLDGIIWSGAGHSLSVAVDVVPVTDEA